MKIVRKYLSASQISPTNQRWDATCDCPQVTPDDGTTWNDAPGLDTRHVDGYRQPPLTTSDPQCDAAANMVAQVRASVDLIVSRGSLVGAASPLLTLWLIAIGPVAWLIDLIVIGLEAVLSIGIIAVDAAFTEAVYDDLLCIFYANMGADGQVSAAQFADILTAIDGLDSVVNATLDAFFNVWGEVGLFNAGATGSETGDCAACNTDCLAYFNGDDGWADWTPYILEGIDLANYDAGNDWVDGGFYPASGVGVNYVLMWLTLPSSGLNITALNFTVDWQRTRTPKNTVDIYALDHGNEGTLVPIYNSGNAFENGDDVAVTIDPFAMPEGYNQIYIQFGAPDDGSQTAIMRIKAVEVCF